MVQLSPRRPSALHFVIASIEIQLFSSTLKLSLSDEMRLKFRRYFRWAFKCQGTSISFLCSPPPLLPCDHASERLPAHNTRARDIFIAFRNCYGVRHESTMPNNTQRHTKGESYSNLIFFFFAVRTTTCITMRRHCECSHSRAQRHSITD